jgi:hypothetical protein
MIRLSAFAGVPNSSRNIAARSHLRWLMTPSRWVDSYAAISAQNGPRDRLLKPKSDAKTFAAETLAINYLPLHGRLFLQRHNLRWLTRPPRIAGNYADAVRADVIGVRHFFAGRRISHARQPYRDNNRKPPLHPAVEMSDLHLTQALARRGLPYGARRMTNLDRSFPSLAAFASRFDFPRVLASMSALCTTSFGKPRPRAQLFPIPFVGLPTNPVKTLIAVKAS